MGWPCRCRQTAVATKCVCMEKARAVDFVGERDLAKVMVVSCTKCGAKVQGAKFCPECGTPTAVKKACANCGAVADGSPKFCPDCGKAFGG